VSLCDYCWSMFTRAIESFLAIDGSQWSGSIVAMYEDQHHCSFRQEEKLARKFF
jgi:hypothetical protein